MFNIQYVHPALPSKIAVIALPEFPIYEYFSAV